MATETQCVYAFANGCKHRVQVRDRMNDTYTMDATTTKAIDVFHNRSLQWLSVFVSIQNSVQSIDIGRRDNAILRSGQIPDILNVAWFLDAASFISIWVLA